MTDYHNHFVIACDDRGNPTGEYPKRELAHTGQGQHHLAITVLLYNSKGQVLLQKRKHRRFDDVWDFTGATDLLHQDGVDETFEKATARCLKREYGIENIKLQNLGGFNYFAEYGGSCENEHCAMMIGEYNGEIKLNEEVGYGYKWMDKTDFLNDIQRNPSSYSPWAVVGIDLLLKSKFF